MVDIKSTMIFSGNANKPLDKMVAQNLGITLG
jgi:phosphoribosylpyrophosphate synthetase